MEDLSEQIDKNELIDFHINMDLQFKTFSSELKLNYQQLNILIESYKEELAKVLILERRQELKNFFSKINIRLLNFDIIFEKINNKDIQQYIHKRIKEHRKYNLTLAKFYLFSSHDDRAHK